MYGPSDVIRNDFSGLLDRLTRQAGKNLIMVTHSAEAASYADRVLCFQAGQLDECPSHE